MLFLGILIAVLEVAGVATVLPFLELAANPNALDEHSQLQTLYDLLGLTDQSQLIVVMAWLALIFMTLANILAVVSIWFQQKIAWRVSHHVSMRLVNTYAALPYHFFLNKDSSDLIRSAIDDINNLIENIVLAGCRLVSQLLIVGLILILLILVHPVIALTTIMTIGCIYTFIVLTRRAVLIELGKESLQTTSDRYRTFVDFISGIKTIKSSVVANHFIERFEIPSSRYSSIRPLIQISYAAPRYLVETLAFGSILFIILYLAKSNAGFIEALPTLTLFTLAGYRLIPAINGVYVSLAQMLNSYPAIDHIYEDVQAALNSAESLPETLTFNKKIKISSVCYSYPETKNAAITNLSMEIFKGSKIALVGPSGSGKTTLVDLILGLLEPDQGDILVDGAALTKNHHDAWRQMIGYVPQDVFLYDNSIANNIAFGERSVDLQRVKKAAHMAQIGTFIETQLADQYESQIGERGVKLSGGQRQRLGLARALYRDPQVLILDEATSALDNVTEGDVVRAIHEEIPGVTIIMIAHRISTVIRCDNLFVIDRGEVVAEGSYEELVTTNALFRDLASFD